MNNESHDDSALDTTLTVPSETTPVRKRKRVTRRKNATTAQTTQNSGFKVPIGDSGKVVQSAWYFGG